MAESTARQPPMPNTNRNCTAGDVGHPSIQTGPTSPVEDAPSQSAKPDFPPFWHWRAITGLNPSSVFACTAAFIRLSIAQMSIAPPPELTPDQRRKVAIILGVCRTTCTALYDLTDDDLIADEKAEPWLVAIPRDDGTVNIAARASLPDHVRAALVAPLELSFDEKSAVAAIHNSAIGLLPLQGYSLATCGHNYLSDPATDSWKAFEMVEKAHWRSQSVLKWFADDVEIIRDAMWHKAGHPVSRALKRRLAYDDVIAKMLEVAGAVEAASVLPALEPEMRAATSYVTLFQIVRMIMKTVGRDVCMNEAALERAMAVVRGYSSVRPTSEETEVDLAGMPGTVKNRLTALEYLQAVVDENKDQAAFCYGFYCALLDENKMLASDDILKASFCLAKLKEEGSCSYIEGQQAYSEYSALRRARWAKGEFQMLKIATRD